MFSINFITLLPLFAIFCQLVSALPQPAPQASVDPISLRGKRYVVRAIPYFANSPVIRAPDDSARALKPISTITPFSDRAMRSRKTRFNSIQQRRVELSKQGPAPGSAAAPSSSAFVSAVQTSIDSAPVASAVSTPLSRPAPTRTYQAHKAVHKKIIRMLFPRWIAAFL
ncbi:hypothetical protein HGRIS_013807 [Hohenbuehelia grisea]|uniref:Uncharacterized protein n=1 Tax=Hohenbuehelia grisea TaxID=104357 RepID=A0ABR3IWP5_9AGAR